VSSELKILACLPLVRLYYVLRLLKVEYVLVVVVSDFDRDCVLAEMTVGEGRDGESRRGPPLRPVPLFLRGHRNDVSTTYDCFSENCLGREVQKIAPPANDVRT
jgi:hypothetical protein